MKIDLIENEWKMTDKVSSEEKDEILRVEITSHSFTEILDEFSSEFSNCSLFDISLFNEES